MVATTLKGVVTKAGAMGKTITVTVARKWVHPILLKESTRHKKYLVHDEAETARVSDTVTIRLGKPMSRRKSFHLLSIDGKSAAATEREGRQAKSAAQRGSALGGQKDGSTLRKEALEKMKEGFGA